MRKKMLLFSSHRLTIEASRLRPLYWIATKILCLSVLLFYSLILPGATPAFTDNSLGISEYEVKAAFILNVIPFVNWPDENLDSQRRVCILGVNPFGDTLSKLAMAKGTQTKILILTSLDKVEGCHLLYISPSENSRLESIISSVHTVPTLTISDIPGFADRGGMVGLFLEDGRVRFDANFGAASDSRLLISSRLLSLARKVIE